MFQPPACPIQVPSGTPSTLAIVKPANMSETTVPLFSAGIVSLATVIAIVCISPHTTAVTTLAPISKG